MKKILTILIIGIVISLFPATSVMAEDEVEDIVDTKEGTVNLTATKASSYSIQFPSSNDVSTSGATITLKAKGDVDSAYQIEVAVKDDATKKLVDNADSNNTVDITVTTGDPILGSAVGAAYGDSASTVLTITHDGITAGTYSYALPIVISLEAVSAQA